MWKRSSSRKIKDLRQKLDAITGHVTLEAPKPSSALLKVSPLISIGLPLIGTIIGGAISAFTSYYTVSLSLTHQDQAEARGRLLESSALRSELLAELQFEAQQLDTVVSSKYFPKGSEKIFGFILLPGSQIFAANLNKLNLLQQDEVNKLYSAESYYNLARDQMLIMGDLKAGDIEIFKDEKKAEGFIDATKTSQTVIQEAIRLLTKYMKRP